VIRRSTRIWRFSRHVNRIDAPGIVGVVRCLRS